MRNNHKAKKFAMRISAMGLALVMVISLIDTLSLNASAVVSLRGIEMLKNSGNLSILEIVPQAGSGSIGYYVGGQEPTSNWSNQVAAISGAQNRANYANALFAKLQNTQDPSLALMSPATDTGLDADTIATTYPLTYKGQYQEYKPWDNVDKDTLVPLKLLVPEEQTVKGEIRECTNGEEGDYALNNTYMYDPDSGSAEYIENVAYYEYFSAEDAYYYHVDFEQVHFVDVKPAPDAPDNGDIFIDDYLEDHPEVPLYTMQLLGDLPYYQYEGTLTENGSFKPNVGINNAHGYYIAKPDYTTISEERELVVETTIPTIKEGENAGMVDLEAIAGKTFYVVDDTTGTPDDPVYKKVEIAEGFEPYPNKEDPTLNPQYYTQDKAHSYMATLDSEEPFREAESEETPFFKKETGYRYVGIGNGDYIFTRNENGSFTTNIAYDTIYVSGGYTNNEWFKRYVLDMDSGFNTVDITVDCYTPDDTRLTAAKVSSYDMVVISAGLDLNDPTKTLSYTTDLKSEVYNEIIKKPHVVDVGFNVHSSLAQNAYLRLVKNGKSTPSVTATDTNVAVYYFAPTALDDSTTATRLITNQFHTAISGTTLANNPYTVVADEIKYENMLRTNDQYLDTNISMATCFRYVINTYRVINKKTSLQVLDIQPVPRYDEQTTESNDSGPLKVSTVLSWLPQSMQDQLLKKDGSGQHDITITHMSTAALVGKIEDITEEYDLIYIGAATSASDLTYLDEKLGDNDDKTGDDYHYANIGAQEVMHDYIKGLLATDSTLSNPTTRYSGNDLTPSKVEELVEFAKTRMPIVLSSNLVTDDGSVETTEYTMSVTLELTENKAKIKPVLTFDPPLSSDKYRIVSYQWECKDQNNLGSAATASEITPTNNYRYRCKVTIELTDSAGTTFSATSRYYKYSATYGSGGSTGKFADPEGTWTSLKRVNREAYYSGTASQDSSAGTVTVKPSYSTSTDQKYTKNTTYQWYQGTRPNPAGPNNNPVAEGEGGKLSTFTFKNKTATKYYCELTITYDNNSYKVYSPTFTWVPPAVSNVTLSQNGTEQATNGTVRIDRYVAGTGEIALDPSKIDPNSLMYQALNSIWNDDNVNLLIDSQLTIPENNTEENLNTNKLVNALNLSRPAINMPENRQPSRYSETLSSNYQIYGDCAGSLVFEFQIENITDPDPANTQYQCNLYIDQNGDGRHDEDELIPGITIERVTESGTNKTSRRVTNGTLQSNSTGATLQANNNSGQDITYYRVSRSLNSGEANQFSGIAAWKLEVVKVAPEGADAIATAAANRIHASEKGYAYIHPRSSDPNNPTNRTKLNVLQVRSSFHGYNTSSADLSTPADENWEDQVTNNLTYNNKALTTFQELYYQLYKAGMYDISVASTEVKNLNNLKTRAAIFAELNKYDMVILGFEDVYGNFDMPAANAIVDYIDTGKALLFTHDTTSYWNDPEYDAADNNRKGWGFWFNQVIRDKVGLDRYGATNPTYGKQVTASGNKYASTYGWVTLGENGKIDESAADTLKENNYTVAYVPGDVRDNVGYSARETQGYTNSIIERNRKTNQVSGNKETTTVSQVNEGQITEYPYNLNESLTIKTTHSQYYQLNMNADDVVVWYCLGGTKFADEKNDATNAYYIYNRGNITYSGAGHTASGLSDDESKLFVNTMIAAYRAGAGAAGVSFRTAADDEASVLLFPVQSHMEEIEENGVKKSVKVTESLSSEQTTFFKITNSNLKTDNTTMSVKLYYEVPAGTTGAVSATTLGVTISHDETTNANLYMKEVSLLSNSIRHADNGDPASANNLSSDVLYKMAIPSEVLNYMAGVEGDGKLYLVGTTVITSDAGTNTYKSFDALTLKQLGLLRLE